MTEAQEEYIRTLEKNGVYKVTNTVELEDGELEIIATGTGQIGEDSWIIDEHGEEV